MSTKKDELLSLIQQHDKAYWIDHKPTISDAEYDQLVLQLNSLDLPFNNQVQDSQNLVLHFPIPMLSLDKCYSEKEIISFYSVSSKSQPLIVTPKIDGMALSLHYNNGCLSLALTRGDGISGENVTQAVIDSQAVPLTIPNLSPLVVRGEIYLPISAFNNLTEKSNPRNAIAGFLNRKNTHNLHSIGIKFFAYDLVNNPLPSLDLTLSFLNSLGFSIPPFFIASAPHELQPLFDHFQSQSLDYELDGVVYRINNTQSYLNSGFTSHHPKGAIAYKFQGNFNTATLLDVEWQISRNGLLTPVGIISPTSLNGATVSRISLHHANTIQSKNLSLNSTVLVVRRGGVIPHLEKVLQQSPSPIHIPSSCPFCLQPTSYEDPFLFCSSKENCPSTLPHQILHYAQTLQIDGLGLSWIEKLVESSLISSIPHIYSLTTQSLLSHIKENMAQTRAEAFISQINKIAQSPIPLHTFLQALGIPSLGKKASETLCSHFKYDLSAIRNASPIKDLQHIEGFGSITALAIFNGLKQKSTLIDQLLQVQNISTSQNPTQNSKSFLFTGTLSSIKRSDAEKIVLQHGHSIASSVTHSLDYLVVGPTGAGSKLDKAKSIPSISILSETQFLQLFSKK
jgi:DNA ligase (NAD+)